MLPCESKHVEPGRRGGGTPGSYTTNTLSPFRSGMLIQE